jgi:hypothetical protein
MSANPAAESDDILQTLLDKHGELMHGDALWRALGFRSERSFQRAVQCSQIAVTLFTLPGRRGRYAKTREVAGWLNGLGQLA